MAIATKSIEWAWGWLEKATLRYDNQVAHWYEIRIPLMKKELRFCIVLQDIRAIAACEEKP